MGKVHISIYWHKKFIRAKIRSNGGKNELREGKYKRGGYPSQNKNK